MLLTGPQDHIEITHLTKKPVAKISAFGGPRAQYHFRQTSVFLNMYPINGPEVILPFAQDKFEANDTNG